MEQQPRHTDGQFGEKTNSAPETSLPRASFPLVPVKFQNFNRMLDTVMEPSRRDDYILDPPYQRGSVWSPEQRVNLIRSILMGLPIGSITLNNRGWQGSGNPTIAVIDGRQRIEALRAFRDDEFGIPAEWLEPEHVISFDASGDVRWSGTARVFQRRFENSGLPVLEAEVLTVDGEAQIFVLLNSAGSSQDEATLTKAREIATTNGETR